MINFAELFSVEPNNKFGRKNEEYDQQVHHYMELLRDMGYKKVKGYLWYVYKNEIKQVLL